LVARSLCAAARREAGWRGAHGGCDDCGHTLAHTLDPVRAAGESEACRGSREGKHCFSFYEVEAGTGLGVGNYDAACARCGLYLVRGPPSFVL